MKYKEVDGKTKHDNNNQFWYISPSQSHSCGGGEDKGWSSRAQVLTFERSMKQPPLTKIGSINQEELTSFTAVWGNFKVPNGG
mmetsp:Transcript_21080/g.40855  ORF Transcript_21080/g.40855 Transcript_21080/m.40855 type:complete len:83 (-) Transcript_21080:868-1116(-)